MPRPPSNLMITVPFLVIFFASASTFLPRTSSSSSFFPLDGSDDGGGCVGFTVAVRPWPGHRTAADHIDSHGGNRRRRRRREHPSPAAIPDVVTSSALLDSASASSYPYLQHVNFSSSVLPASARILIDGTRTAGCSSVVGKSRRSTVTGLPELISSDDLVITATMTIMALARRGAVERGKKRKKKSGRGRDSAPVIAPFLVAAAALLLAVAAAPPPVAAATVAGGGGSVRSNCSHDPNMPKHLRCDPP
ncbi:uncharacterized protein LOC107304890 [Oryza brachyantha]|uniref:uncharacterized protein LOC107304890 n=1 Tax=Oryza brachyantha TaxID=4533 RepID=UPI0007764994|nr:uncharacterized protein LOC107304890 [Oryza brachyantha]